MNINETINYVNDFFVDKIINKDYVELETDRHKASFDIYLNNIKYPFVLWISSGWFYLRTYSGSFMDLSFTDQQKRIIYERFYKIQEAKIEAMKKKEYEQLKNKFESKTK